MQKFVTTNGLTVTGDVVEYFTSESGEQRVRIRVRNSRVTVTARVAGLLVEVA